MKKILAVLAAIVLSLSLCACSALEGGSSEIREVHIVAGAIEPGMSAKDVLVEVTIDNQPVPCRTTFTGYAWDGYWEMEDDEPVEDGFFVCLNVFYSLPEGCDTDGISVTMECEGGEYDGTGSISFDDDGNVEAWSRAFYGEEPVAPEDEGESQEGQESQESQPEDSTSTQPQDPVQVQPQHTHNWTEVPGPSFVPCTIDRVISYTCECGETKTETIPAPGHDLREWSINEPTCTEDGRKTTSCKRCGEGFVVELPALGHEWSDWEKKTGRVHSHTCVVCGAEEEEAHNIPSDSVTCTGCGADIIN